MEFANILIAARHFGVTVDEGIWRELGNNFELNLQPMLNDSVMSG